MQSRKGHRVGGDGRMSLSQSGEVLMEKSRNSTRALEIEMGADANQGHWDASNGRVGRALRRYVPSI